MLSKPLQGKDVDILVDESTQGQLMIHIVMDDGDLGGYYWVDGHPDKHYTTLRNARDAAQRLWTEQQG